MISFVTIFLCDIHREKGKLCREKLQQIFLHIRLSLVNRLCVDVAGFYEKVCAKLMFLLTYS